MFTSFTFFHVIILKYTHTHTHSSLGRVKTPEEYRRDRDLALQDLLKVSPQKVTSILFLSYCLLCLNMDSAKLHRCLNWVARKFSQIRELAPVNLQLALESVGFHVLICFNNFITCEIYHFISFNIVIYITMVSCLTHFV